MVTKPPHICYHKAAWDVASSKNPHKQTARARSQTNTASPRLNRPEPKTFSSPTSGKIRVYPQKKITFYTILYILHPLSTHTIRIRVCTLCWPNDDSPYIEIETNRMRPFSHFIQLLVYMLVLNHDHITTNGQAATAQIPMNTKVVRVPECSLHGVVTQLQKWEEKKTVD